MDHVFVSYVGVSGVSWHSYVDVGLAPWNITQEETENVLATVRFVHAVNRRGFISARV